jgi:hypothetical protein
MEWLLEQTGLLLILAFISQKYELRLSKRRLEGRRLFQPDLVEDEKERDRIIETLKYISESSSTSPDPKFSPRKNREILWKAFNVDSNGSISKKEKEVLRISAVLHFRFEEKEFDKIYTCTDKYSEYFVCLRIQTSSIFDID